MADTYHVNPGIGLDTNPGTEAYPFATTDKAASIAIPGDSILLARGYKYPPIVVSGLDADVSERIYWGSYGIGLDPVVSASIDPSGSWVNESGNLWSYSNAGFVDVKSFVIDGSNKAYGRWPKRSTAEYYTIESNSGNTSITDSVNLPGAPNFVGGELASKKRKWTIDRNIITAQNSTTLTVSGSDVSYKSGNGYFVQNHINCVTEDEDWCFDSVQNKVFLYSTTDPNTLSIKISFDQHALHLTSCDYHSFSDIVFESAWEHNIFLEFSLNTMFSRCTSRYAGVNGIQTFVSEDMVWDDSFMYDINNSGVQNRDASEGLTVLDSSFVRIAILPGMGEGGSNQQNAVFINNTEHNALIDGNFIFQVGNCGVYYRGNNCYVGNNYARQCGFTVSDAACFYSFGNFSNPYINLICERNSAFESRGNIDGIGGTPQYDTCGYYTDDNSQNIIVRENYAEECGYGYYIHNNQNVSYENNIGFNCDKLVRISDDNVQGVGSTLRVRNISLTGNSFKALTGQVLISARTIGDFSNDGPFDYGTINTNNFDSPDALPFEVELTQNFFPTAISLADWRNDYGFDINSTTNAIDDTKTIVVVNDTSTTEIVPLNAIYEDWDGTLYDTGSITLSPNKSETLFYVGELPEPPPDPNAKIRGIRFVSLNDYYGQSVYDTYTRAKANDAVLGASLMDIKPIADKVLAFGWDMVNVPVAYKDNALYSLIGPDLVVSGGGNGSRFDKDGLLVTELPNDRPRFAYNPETGLFEGLDLEVEDTNLITDSENFENWTKVNSILLTANTEIAPDGSVVNGYDFTDSAIYKDSSTSSIIGDIYTNSIWIKANYEAQIAIRRPGGETLASASALVEIKTEWERFIITDNADNSLLRLLIDNRNANLPEQNPGLILYLFGGKINKGENTSYIKTESTAVTRPADIYTASGIINTANPYSLFEIRNGQKILNYIEPGLGTVKKYVDGILESTEPVTPSNDLVLSSQGSDTILAVGYKAGILTEQERINRTL